MAKGRKLYDVDCINESGRCYATHCNCTWDGVQRYKKLAKMLGETIDVQHVGYEKTS